MEGIITRPCCPNHAVEMEATDNPGIWICPISRCDFDVEVDITDTSVEFDKWGNPIKRFTIRSLDGSNNG